MKKFRMPSAFTTLFLIIFAIAILTWIVPAGTYEYVDPTASKLQPVPGTYSPIPQNPQGIHEVLTAPISGFFDGTDIILFILIIGGYLGLVMKTGAIDAGIGAAIRKLDGRQQIMIPLLMILFGLGGTIFGMSEETIPFYLLVIPIFLASGYDALLAVATVFLGASIGCIGSTVNPFSIGIASGFAGVSIGEGIFVRLFLLVVLETVGAVYLMRYAKKIKADPSKSLVFHLKADHETMFLQSAEQETPVLTSRRKGILAVFGLTFFIMMLGVIPWASKFDIYIFENLNQLLTTAPVIGPLVGHLTPLGEWWFGDMSVLFMISSLVISIIARFGEAEAMDIFLAGAKDLLGVALIVGITRGIAVIMNDGGMTATVLHWGEESLKSLGSVAFVNLSYLFYLPLTFLVPSTSGLATLSMPIMAPLADFAGVNRDLIITIFNTSNGTMNLITPTSGVLMGALAMAKIPFATYLRFVGKLVINLAVIIMATLTAAIYL